uniref:EGF-like domain-containing protein n=1 Tax=Nothobranchius furzeri TaxID=105023 RepID=A0A8C6K5K8_NOTFU
MPSSCHLQKHSRIFLLCFVLNGTECQDVDECHESNGFPCPEHSLCNNTVGSYFCLCSPGYDSSNSSCQDIDECKYNTTCRSDQVCTNLPGAYNCSCPLGYHEEKKACFTGNGSWCTDVDECALMHPCPSPAQCYNTPGSFLCVCMPGFIGFGPLCVDVNECLQAPGQCHSAATCINSVGSFKCSCNLGWNTTKDNGPAANSLMRLQPLFLTSDYLQWCLFVATSRYKN